MQVSGERAKSANARHECFAMDASVSVKTAETAELDERRQPGTGLTCRQALGPISGQYSPDYAGFSRIPSE